jgi:excisionase family DNA binding protein
MMKDVFTPKELAAAIGVSESSLRRWVDSGAIQTARTVGGHRRIPLAEAVRFIRESHATVVRPELLGLDEVHRSSRDDPQQNQQLADRLYDALANGDAPRARGLLLSLYLSGHSVAALADGPIRQAMHRLGELWRHEQRGILVEHRATDICIGAVHRLRELLPAPPADAPVAVGSAPEGDPYLLPTLLAATVLHAAGYRAINLGPQTPVHLLELMVKEHDPRLVWLSLSVAEPDQHIRRELRKLAQALQPRNASLVIGGRAATATLAQLGANVQVVESMTELSAFARGAQAAPH